MDYKDRVLEELLELVVRRVKLEQSEFIQNDSLMQKQAEAMFNYEAILRERILKIMHESDCVEVVDTKGVRYCE